MWLSNRRSILTRPISTNNTCHRFTRSLESLNNKHQEWWNKWLKRKVMMPTTTHLLKISLMTRRQSLSLEVTLVLNPTWARVHNGLILYWVNTKVQYPEIRRCPQDPTYRAPRLTKSQLLLPKALLLTRVCVINISISQSNWCKKSYKLNKKRSLSRILLAAPSSLKSTDLTLLWGESRKLHNLR